MARTHPASARRADHPPGTLALRRYVTRAPHRALGCVCAQKAYQQDDQDRIVWRIPCAGALTKVNVQLKGGVYGQRDTMQLTVLNEQPPPYNREAEAIDYNIYEEDPASMLTPWVRVRRRAAHPDVHACDALSRSAS